MHRACGAGFALHFYDFRHDTPQVLVAGGRPRVGEFAHAR